MAVVHPEAAEDPGVGGGGRGRACREPSRPGDGRLSEALFSLGRYFFSPVSGPQPKAGRESSFEVGERARSRSRTLEGRRKEWREGGFPISGAAERRGNAGPVQTPCTVAFGGDFLKSSQVDSTDLDLNVLFLGSVYLPTPGIVTAAILSAEICLSLI